MKAEPTGETSFITADPFFLDEAGKHVVQREHRRGKRHTSTVTVSVLPIEAQQHQLRDQDITVTTQRGHGPGGQHQNKTDSAVRMVHEPTGTMVFINGRKQLDNRKTARRVLEQRVRDAEREKQVAERNQLKRAQVGGGARGGKRRTYNFIRDQVTDHRTGKKSRCRDVMRGRFD